MIRRIDRIVLRVPALKPAVRFYREAMGLVLLKEDARLASLRMPDGETELVLHADPDLPAEAVYYLVDDVRGLHARREELGIQFTQSPVAVARGYRAAIRDPFGNILLIVDRTLERSATATAAIEHASPAGTLFPGVGQEAKLDRDLVINTYVGIGRVTDDLPYTPDFEKLYAICTAAQAAKSTRENLWRTLLTIRKAGKLPKLGEARSRPPATTDEEKQWWRDQLGEEIGRRDRLPYSQRFDQLVDEFNKLRARPVSPHLLWRLVATLAK